MYIINGIVYGENEDDPLSIEAVKPLKDRMMSVRFQNGETRLFGSECLTGSAFDRLNDPAVFEHPVIEHGIVTWDDGSIDCSTEYIHKHSYDYMPPTQKNLELKLSTSKMGFEP